MEQGIKNPIKNDTILGCKAEFLLGTLLPSQDEKRAQRTFQVQAISIGVLVGFQMSQADTAHSVLASQR